MDMGIAKGTRLTDNPKNITLKIRLDDETSNKLDFLADKKSTSRADVIRKGIEIQYEQEK